MGDSVPQYALALAARGLPVFPCDEKKRPTLKGGFHAAETDPARVRALWRAHGGPLIGVPTGAVSGFDVLDLDLVKHPEGGDWWGSRRERAGLTRVHGTRSGGEHWLFRHRPGLTNSAGVAVPGQARRLEGIDRRTDGGYIVWWPAAGCDVYEDVAPAPWPEWLFAELTWKPPPPRRDDTAPRDPGAQGRPYALGALRQSIQRVATAGPGTRNDALNRETWNLARFLVEGTLAPGEIANAMAAAAQAAGLAARETLKTIESALAAPPPGSRA